MSKVKTQTEAPAKQSPPPVAELKAPTPRKAAGRAQAAPQQASSGSAARPARAADILTESARGAADRARSTTSLQRSVGNARVSRMVNTSAAAAASPFSIAPPLLRQCACGGTAGPGGACAECQAQGQTVQRQAVDADPKSSLPSSVTEVLGRGGGEPLPKSARGQMEAALGVGLGGARVHTGPQAARAARDISASAFTVGQDIYFGEGQYQPDTPQGQRLLAHELTHTVQQASGAAAVQSDALISQPGDPLEREAEAVANRVSNGQTASPRKGSSPQPSAQRHVARQQAAPAAANPAVEEAVKAIIADLTGVTTRWASARILAQFKDHEALAPAIMQGLKNHAGEQGMSAEGMIDWLFGDMTAEDSRELRRFLVKHGVVGDLARITATQVKDLLEGYTSESNSLEIYSALSEYGGTQLEVVLKQLEALTGKGGREMSEWLFGDMYRVTAERLRQHFFAAGGPDALRYAVDWTASKIYSLVKSYSTHADSSSIVWNFETTPPAYRVLVLERLNQLTGNAEEVLMRRMDQSDYESLQVMGGLKLAQYVDKRNWAEKAASAVEWSGVVAQWIVCGVAGIITGVLSAIWEIIKGIWDIVVAVWHLIWSLVYLISGGAAGSENWLAVKEFFGGLGETLGSPKKAWDQYWESLKLEIKTIEGSFTSCRQAEFIVRKFITAVVNVALILLAGYGAAKIAVSAASGAAELAALAREVGVLRALVQFGGKARRALGKLVVVGAEEAGQFAKALLNPVQTLIKVGQRINVVITAAREEGVWTFLRKQAGTWVEGERKVWEKKKQSWLSRSDASKAKHGELSEEAAALQESLAENKAPEHPDKVAGDLAGDTKKLEGEVDDLYKDVTESEKETAPEKKTEPETKPAETEPVKPPPELPESWDRLFEPSYHEEVRAELRELRGNDDLTHFDQGGEGYIFDSQKKPTLALKRWYKSRLTGDQGMGESIRKLRSINASVEANAKLSADVEVVKIHKQGSDWVLRDFDPTSVPLKNVLTDADIAAVRTRVIEALQGTTDSELKDFLKRLRREPPSINYRWSATKRKILIIDMQ